jgi:general secretion pathway protein C
MQRAWHFIEITLRRYPWVLTLLTLIPCAYFAAVGTNHLIVSSVLKADVTGLTRAAPPPPPGSPGASTPSPSETSFHSRDVHQILTRNIFDADAGCLTCAPAPTPTAEVADAGPATPTTEQPLEACAGTARVLGAVEADDPLWSFIFLAPSANQPSMPYRMGQMFDGKTVASIGYHQQFGPFVILRQGTGPGSTRCFYAQVMPPRPAPPPPAATPAPAPHGDGQSGELSAVMDRIERTGNNEYTMPRSAVDRILENQADLMRQTRIMPHEEGGRTVGVQLFGVRGNSLLGRLGMQNGDILNRINGLEIASPDRALEAYSRLRTADHITITVTRNGAPVNIDFNIR